MGSMSAGMKTFVEVAAKKWFVSAWKDKVAGAFTNSSSFSGDKLNTLLGLVINAMQHGMIYVGLGMMPSANRPGDMNSTTGPGPEAHNRVGSFVGPMSASFQVNPPDAPSCCGDYPSIRQWPEGRVKWEKTNGAATHLAKYRFAGWIAIRAIACWHSRS
jgi:NAD(P)H dehydrogenase (quinone)